VSNAEKASDGERPLALRAGKLVLGLALKKENFKCADFLPNNLALELEKE
jgi:hypothetical protein